MREKDLYFNTSWYLRFVIQNILNSALIKGCLTNETWRNGTTCMLSNLVLVVNMGILSIILILQRLYTLVPVLSMMLYVVAVVVNSTGYVWLGQTNTTSFLGQYILKVLLQIKIIKKLYTSDTADKRGEEGYYTCKKIVHLEMSWLLCYFLV